MKNFMVLVVALVLLVSVKAMAQLSLSVTVMPNPSPFISDWRSHPNTVQFVVTNPSSNTFNVRFTGFIQGEQRGRVAETKPDAGVAPVVIGPGTAVLTALDVHFIDEGAVRFMGPTRNEVEHSGRLPDDRFQLCIRIVQYDHPEKALSQEVCRFFTIRVNEAPQLIMPDADATVRTPPRFSWSSVSLGAAGFAAYELTVVELGDDKTTSARERSLPASARFDRATVLAKVEPRTASYQWLPSDPPLTPGSRYAWRVQASDPEARFLFENKGLSEIRSFVYEPLSVVAKDTKDHQTVSFAEYPVFQKEDLKPVNIFPFINTSCTISGRLGYTFDPGQLLPEPAIDQALLSYPKTSGLPGAAHVVVRLMRGMRLIPRMDNQQNSVYDDVQGKAYDLTAVPVASTTTDEKGNFSFDFIDADSVILVTGHSFRCGGGEFKGYTPSGTLYKYYSIQVVDPYYCSPETEIPVLAGSPVTIALSSLVRTYNLDVTVKDQETNQEIGSTARVTLARLLQLFVPSTMPADEGELSPAEGDNAGTFANGLPTTKYQTNTGYVTSVHGTQDAPSKGHVLFTRLVRSVGGIDGYLLSAETPQKKPDGNTNEMYYAPNIFCLLYQRVQRDPDSKFISWNWSEEVVFNHNFVISTFTTSITMKPLLPRMFGLVKRSDSKKALPGSMASLLPDPIGPFDLAANPTWPFTMSATANTDGYFEMNEIPPTGNSSSYVIIIGKTGYKSWLNGGVAVRKGRQYDLGVVELDPKQFLTRTVIDEFAQPLPGVKGVLGFGAEQVTGDNGVFASPAVPGYNWIHLEKKLEYADKDSIFEVKDNSFEALGAIFAHKIVMFEAKRRLSVHVHDAKGTPIEGVVVILDDYYKPIIIQGNPIPSDYRAVTGPDGVATFVYKSPATTVNVSLRVPNSDWIATKRSYSNVPEDGRWAVRYATLDAGGHIAGRVLLGGKKTGAVSAKSKKKGLNQTPLEQATSMTVNLPVAGARVFVEGYPELSTFTGDDGSYLLQGVPAGIQVVHAAKSSQDASQTLVGEKKLATVLKQQQTNVDFYLTTFSGMNISHLLGFPIEIDKLTETAGGKVRIDGAFVSVPGNPVCKPLDAKERYEFSNVDLMPTGSGTPPPAKPVAGAVPLEVDEIDLSLHGLRATLVSPSGLTVQPVGTDMLKGSFTGQVRVLTSVLPVNAQQMSFAEAIHVSAPGASPSAAPLVTYGVLPSDASAPAKGGEMRITNASGGDAAFTLCGYPASATAKQSTINSSGMHLQAVAHAKIKGCGADMGASCDIGLAVGEVTLTSTAFTSFDPSKIPAQNIALQLWSVKPSSVGFASGYFTLNGQLNAPLVPNHIVDETTLKIPFTGMELRPTELTNGSFAMTSIDLLGIATMQVSVPPVLASDSKSWFLATSKPVIPASQPGGKKLQGLDPSDQILLNTFYLRSDASKDVNPSSSPLLAYEVGSFAPTTFQFGYDTKPYLSMLGSLTLVNFPNLAPQATRFYWTPGGVFGMDPVNLIEPYIAGGVKLLIANGILTPEGFIAQGTAGKYENRIVLDGAFTFVSVLRHRKVSGGYSTISEIINSGHTPPMSQELFGSGGGPSVKNVYGRTQVEAGGAWSTNFAGWYQTSELAAKDSMRFSVAGSGGNGTVALGTATMQMKGANGGIGSLLMDGAPRWPKGPAPSPPPTPLADSPFSGMTLTPDFQKMAIMGSMHVKSEISPGVQFEGDLQSVISFGSSKFWCMYAAGKGVVQDPPCTGSAVFIAGLNYPVPADQKQQLLDYSESKEPLPPQFQTMTGFFTQVTVSMPIPGTPNFDLEIPPLVPIPPKGEVHVHCTMGGEARVGLNFNDGTTFFLGVYARATVEGGTSILMSIPMIPIALVLKGNVLVYAGAGGWYTYNSNSGSSFKIKGIILGTVTGEGCIAIPLLGEKCSGTVNILTVGGTIEGQLGAGSYLNITPTFSILGL